MKDITKYLFWGAFGAFLAVSIPHIAWVFHVYEPSNDGWLDSVWWIVSYGAAISVDVIAGWLTFMQDSRNAETRDNIITWAFILSLAALSWYCNWIFGIAHTNTIHIDVWSTPVFFGVISGWTVGKITPIITGAVPLYIIAYSYMSKRLATVRPPCSIEEIEQQAELAVRRSAASMRMSAAKDQERKAWLQSKKWMLQSVAFGNEMELATEPQTEVTPEPQLELATEHPLVVIETVPAEHLTEQQVELLAEANKAQAPEPERHLVALSRRKSKTMTVKEAAQMLSVSERYIRELRSAGTLRSENGLLVSSSVRAYARKKQQAG